MKRGSKLFVMIALLVTLTAVFALLLCACTPGEKNKSNENSNENLNKAAELVVSFDEDAEFTLSSIEDLSELLEVKVVSDGVERVVDFTVKSSTLSEDGKNINVVIVAEGIEKTVQLPYVDEVRALIRKDLRPLYDLCTGEGERGITLALTGGDLWENEISPISATLNFKEDESVEFALTRGSAPADLVASYKDEKLTLFGVTVDMEEMMEHLGAIVEKYRTSRGSETALAGEEESEDDVLFGNDSISTFFIGISSLLDSFDVLAEAMPNAGFSKENGVYRFSRGSSQVLEILQTLIEDDESKALFNLIFEVLNAKTWGAIIKNRFFLDLFFEVTQTGAEASFVAKNWYTGDKYSLSVSVCVFDHVVPLSESVETAVPNDLEITIPISLPQKGVELTVKTEVFLSEVFGKNEDKKCLRTTVTDKDGAVVALFDLSNDGGYFDASGISKLFGEDEPFADAVFYRAFEPNVSPLLSFLEALITDWKDLPDDEQGPETPEVTPSPDVRFERGYGVTILEGVKLLFDFGETLAFDGAATEADVRSRLFAYYLNEEGERVEYSDYEVLDFDGSIPFKGKVTIRFAPGYSVSLPVLTYYSTSGPMSFKAIPLGTTFEELKDLYIGELSSHNGRYFWTELLNGFSVKTVHSAELKSSVFDEIGKYSITFTRESTGQDYWANVSVYDPANPPEWDIACTDEVYLTSRASEEEARAQLEVYLYYQDGTKVPVTNYTLFYRPGATDLVVYYNIDPTHFFSKQVAIRHVEDYTDCLRFFNRFDNKSILVQFIWALRDEYVVNKGLFAEVFDIERTQDNLKLHLPINNEANRDLFKIAGRFVKLPGANKGIDENEILDYLDKLKSEDPDMDIAALFKRVVGVELSDFFESLYLDVEVGSDGSMTVSLNDGEGRDYFVTGLSVRPVEATERTPISEEKINAVSGFDKLPEFLFEIASRLLGI